MKSEAQRGYANLKNRVTLLVQPRRSRLEDARCQMCFPRRCHRRRWPAKSSACLPFDALAGSGVSASGHVGLP